MRGFFIVYTFTTLFGVRFILFALLLFGWTRAFAICAKVLEPIQAKIHREQGFVKLNAGEIYTVKGTNKERTKLTLLSGERILIVTREQVKLMKGEDCRLVPTNVERPPSEDSSSETPSQSPTDEVQKQNSASSTKLRSGWRFGGEVALIDGTSSDNYEGLLTSVPDPSNVGSLQDPIVTDVSEGKGYALRGFAEINVLDDLLRWTVGLGYRQQTFSYVAKKNPTTSAVTLEQLESYETEIKLNQIEFGSGLSYNHQVEAFLLGYGFHLDILYNLSGDEKIDLLVASGPFFKNTASSVEAGPAILDFQLKGKLDVRWKGLFASLAVAPDSSYHMGVGYVF